MHFRSGERSKGGEDGYDDLFLFVSHVPVRLFVLCVWFLVLLVVVVVRVVCSFLLFFLSFPFSVSFPAPLLVDGSVFFGLQNRSRW